MPCTLTAPAVAAQPAQAAGQASAKIPATPRCHCVALHGAFQVLILDRFSKDVVAPLMRLNQLRRHGVTLHLQLEAERQPIPDVPAVYLVQVGGFMH